ncbi:PLP-dependent aminotransferase family protein [Poseidonocella sp. HB161398]|uniref:MocR-like pyridoxine biosynthesis transcription factor PdxR n=1 Tax=Poseidonocella sp. HB161398 TaxID=2320855 RepID=UPI001108558D|nr:PLP-dependent aminotransferase family protein [Poseidonocella sp. HB161398]
MSNPEDYAQSNFQAALFALALERGGGAPLHLQLADALRGLLIGGRFAGRKLPASRVLAAELSVSRMTVTTAYDQLAAEGYLATRRGDGTYVADHLPHLVPAPKRPRPAPAPPVPPAPFHPGLPDQALFPHRAWARHLERAWTRPAPALLARADPLGWAPLRQAIAAHLAAWRGLDCDAGQIVVTSGAWDAFDLLRGAALQAGARIAVEDPGWPTQQKLLQRGGLSPCPVRIDGEGLDPARLPGGLAAAIVTPSRHYPTGTAMPLARRLALLGWAEAEGALVIEDDYDSEFRYQGQPLPSLAGLDGLGRTVYMGSFSKLLSPGLRIGYLVLPEALTGAARDHLEVTGARASLLPQPALAAFMESGEFATHLRRMRRVYARRQAHLLACLAPFEGLLSLSADPSGMHLMLPLGPDLAGRVPDREISARAAAEGMVLRALSAHARLPDAPEGLILGYAGFEEPRLGEAAEALGRILRAAAG